MRIMGVDYGDARTGIAMSDLLCSFVGSTMVIHSRNQDKTLSELVRLVQEQGVTEELKARDQMQWVAMMNSLKAQAEEVVMTELINS